MVVRDLHDHHLVVVVSLRYLLEPALDRRGRPEHGAAASWAGPRLEEAKGLLDGWTRVRAPPPQHRERAGAVQAKPLGLLVRFVTDLRHADHIGGVGPLGVNEV